MRDLEHLQKQTSILMNLYNSKRFEDVIQKGKILLKTYPDQIILYNAISLSLSSINKDDEALDILKQALTLQPNNIFVLNYSTKHPSCCSTYHHRQHLLLLRRLLIYNFY